MKHEIPVRQDLRDRMISTEKSTHRLAIPSSTRTTFSLKTAIVLAMLCAWGGVMASPGI